MEKYTMFMNWKNQYSENEYTTQSILFYLFIFFTQSILEGWMIWENSIETHKLTYVK